MTRNLTSGVLAAVSGEVVTRAVAVELDYDLGVVRMAGTPFDIEVLGHTFTGVGALGRISTAEEGADLQAYSMTIQLAGIPRDAIAIALSADYQGRPATIWEVPLDPDTMKPIADPICIFRGRMDTMAVELDKTFATCTVAVTNRLADWERQRTRLFSDEEQQRVHPGDLGLSYATAMENVEINWPASEWFRDFARRHG
ncbi:hypothetical protein [Limobrevibacterium gyesilva]|uniref:Uncharacterized protein n=1 Tax=Limobrevibacterium gyesilva TaxID=2991712 RepID=A0AA41YPL7_9PROT|nr:hypothetical protein [Limobrevibacterium gyesilva]MCW3477369.1 hypothetical protein [Limobrevibacterium gyesilva]